MIANISATPSRKACSAGDSSLILGGSYAKKSTTSPRCPHGRPYRRPYRLHKPRRQAYSASPDKATASCPTGSASSGPRRRCLKKPTSPTSPAYHHGSSGSSRRVLKRTGPLLSTTHGPTSRSLLPRRNSLRPLPRAVRRHHRPLEDALRRDLQRLRLLQPYRYTPDSADGMLPPRPRRSVLRIYPRQDDTAARPVPLMGSRKTAHTLSHHRLQRPRRYLPRRHPYASECTEPLRVSIAGRLRAFINAFGERTSWWECRRHRKPRMRARTRIADYTAAPVYAAASYARRHQWLVEWKHRPATSPPSPVSSTRRSKRVNSDYQAKRCRRHFPRRARK